MATSRGNKDGKGHYLIPSTSSRADYQSGKIGAGSVTDFRISRNHCEQPDPHFLSFKEKGKEVDPVVPKVSQRFPSYVEGTLFSSREVTCHSSGGNSSSLTVKVSPTVLHSGPRPEASLRDSPFSLSRGKDRIEVVGGKPRPHGGTPTSSPVTRTDHLLRCSEDRRLGSSLPSGVDGRSLERGGETITHQRTGAFGSRAGHKILHKGEKTFLHPYEDRQHKRFVVSNKNGRDREPGDDWYHQKDLELPLAVQDHTYCRVDPFPSEYIGGLGVQECVNITGMETQSGDISKSVPDIRPSGHRLVCVQGVPPTEKIFQLDSGSRVHSSGCLLPRLETTFPLCVPTILPYHKSAEKGKRPSSGNMVLIIPLLLSQPFWKTQQARGCIPLLQNSSLSLVAWIVSGLDWKPKEFRRRLRTSSSNHAGAGRRGIMNRPGENGYCGAVEGVWIPLHAL